LIRNADDLAEKCKCCTCCDHSDPISSDDHCDSSDEDNDYGSALVHTHKQIEQEPNNSEEEIQHDFKILLEYLAQRLSDLLSALIACTDTLSIKLPKP
jgi:hypothetical protein